VKNESLTAVCRNFGLWKNCERRVHHAHDVRTFFACPPQSNRRQSRAVWKRRQVGRQIL